MAYTPTPGVFVDGEIIDAADFNTEFALISNGMATDVAALTQTDADNLQEAKDYADGIVAGQNIDGGTF